MVKGIVKKGRLADKFKNMNLLEKILLFLSLFVLCALVLFIFTKGNTWFHSDSAAVVNLANEELRTGQLIPDGWYGSTGILILNFPLILILKFIPDYLLAHNIAQLIFTILMLVSVILFSKVSLNNNSWLLTVPIIFTIFSYTQGDMVFVQCAYTWGITVAFFAISLFSMAFQNEYSSNKNKIYIIIIFSLFLLLTLVLGGAATVQSIVLPLLGAMVIMYIMDNSDKCGKEALPNKKVVYIIIGICAITLIGLIINKHIAMQLNIVDMTPVFSGDVVSLSNNISQLYQGFLYIIGIEPGISFFSFHGIQNILRIVIMTMVIFVFPILSLKNLKYESTKTRFIIIFSAIHVLEIIIVLLFTGAADYSANARYQLTSISLLFAISCNYIYSHYIVKANLLSFIYTISIVAFSVFLSCSTVHLSDYKDRITQNRELTDFLAENGLTYGYATFWHSGVHTVLSNGKVQINNVLIEKNNIQKELWLSSSDWYEPEYFQGRTFLMLYDSELDNYAPDGFEKTALGIPAETLTYGQMTILVYDYNISFNNFDSRLNGQHDFLPDMVCTEEGMRQKNGNIIVSTEKQNIYGPYIKLGAGEYELIVDVSCDKPTQIDINAEYSNRKIDTFNLKSGQNLLSFSIVEDMVDVEFIISGVLNNSIEVKSIFLKKK